MDLQLINYWSLNVFFIPIVLFKFNVLYIMHFGHEKDRLTVSAHTHANPYIRTLKNLLLQFFVMSMTNILHSYSEKC